MGYSGIPPFQGFRSESALMGEGKVLIIRVEQWFEVPFIMSANSVDDKFDDELILLRLHVSYGNTPYLFILNSCNKHLKLPLQTRLELASHVLRRYVLE